MTRVKIISNPYTKEIKYLTYNNSLEEWEMISNGDSELLSDSLSSCFLPFKAKEILDVIIKEYGVDGETINVYFEGTDDEYQELLSVSNNENIINRIELHQSNLELANARDILPDVKKLFNSIKDLIYLCKPDEKTEKDIKRFTDASSDVVPICVIGNYSAGKSTFINALIGCEILPSATEPSTSKVYKISRSTYDDRSYIEFSYDNEPIKIIFSDVSTKFELKTNCELIEKLKYELSFLGNEKITHRVHKALSIINDYENENQNGMISDLIEVSLPFGDGVLSKSLHPFVIFDTPGSNSASNKKHLSVLKKAMQNMTNGLPIFICAPDTLDSTDNEDLYQIISEMDKELDRRFTMIVVNKSDETRQNKIFTEKEQERILSQNVPKRLYSGGIFYASSIMGLGSKINGDFVDDDYDYVFSSHETKFNNPEDRHYMSLYCLDILPEQIKKRTEQQAKEQTNLIYANSGLYSIELSIDSFAGKYAAYNKCFQSRTFLNDMIETTSRKIEDNKKKAEANKSKLENALEKEKRELLDSLKKCANENREEFSNQYLSHMVTTYEKDDERFGIDILKNKQNEYTQNKRNELNYDESLEEKRESYSAIPKDFLEGVNNTLEKAKRIKDKEATFKDLANVAKDTIDDFLIDTKKAFNSTSYVKNLDDKVDKEVANDIVNYAIDMFKSTIDSNDIEYDNKSRNFWEEMSNNIREKLVSIIIGSDVLTEEKRNELEKVVINYEKLEFSDNLSLETREFIRAIKLFNAELIFSEKLNLRKLSNRCKGELTKARENHSKQISDEHIKSANVWLGNLLDEIEENIFSYSPELSKKANSIEEHKKEIKEWIGRQNKLIEYTNQLDEMMNWHDSKEN